jgi:putative phosphoesterase
MRIAALYDIHGNLPALEAVLAEVADAEADTIVVGGDVVPGPMAVETIDRLLALDVPVRFIRGNGEREMLARRAGVETGRVPEPYREAMQWVAEQLRPQDERMLYGWPATTRMVVEGLGRVLFCHATPRNDTEIFTRLTSEDILVAVFANTQADLVICGHTHMQFDRRIGDIRVINAGSIGMPFGEPGAYWLLLEPEPSLRRTAYGGADAAARISATDYPLAGEFAEQYVLRPPTEAKMLDLFSKAELSAEP